MFQKYCGRAVIILNYSKEKEELFKGCEKLASPAHLIALSCNSEEKEREITELLLRQNINYTRSSSDIEIIYTNAKAEYEKSKKTEV